ncbi:MAG TPA: septal ring lytic transglycosylase RlpA family protein [Allosphingosinicella sp.]|nr:septal ring lytic transglycosylase RlpA family protein [Allosphingosinicella sp.]
MVKRLRRIGLPRVFALGLAVLTSAAPAQTAYSVPAPSPRLQSLDQAVASLGDSALDQALATKLPVVQQALEAVGEGNASYYGAEFAGSRTSSGERFDPRAFTCAHRSLPIGSKLKVTNLSNGRSVIVRVNDRGPFTRGRILDMSLAAAREIAMIGPGHARVRLELIRDVA